MRVKFKGLRGLLTSLFPDLSEFDVDRRPNRHKVVKAAEPETANGEVFGGKKYKTEWNVDGYDVVMEQVHSTATGTRSEKLTGWDVSYLNEYHRNGFTKKPTWKREMADRLKAEWATIQNDGEYPSAEAVVKNHTVPGESKPQKGYGLSNVKKYFHAFNDALKAEQEEIQSKPG